MIAACRDDDVRTVQCILFLTFGGFDALYRPDIIISTIQRTFWPYLLTVLMVFGAEGLMRILAVFVLGGMALGDDASQSTSFGGAMLVSLLLLGISIYFEIVAMKLIGLYYRHFKDRFTCTWE